ncbi:MAG: hypothetical protein RLZ98_2295 [Pseudomonadota bacterium]|jgi:TRAP transporter TAXI family solute receptor
MLRSTIALALAAIALASLSPLPSAAQQQLAQTNRAPTAASVGDSAIVRDRNAWTLGLATGTPEGTFLRFGTDIVRNLNKPDDLRVLAIVTRGAADNIKDLLYLKGIDAAITHTDVFEHFRTVEKIRNLANRIHYISGLYTSELHLLVRSDIQSIQDLAGKKVSMDAEGSGATISGPIIFERLGVKVEPVMMNNALALEAMKNGEIAGLLHNAGKPNGLLTGFKNTQGFKLLPIPFDRFEDYYVPSQLTHDDYPNLIKPDERVETIAVPAVLVIYNWPKSSDRFRRIARFIDRYFEQFDNFKSSPYHEKWRDVNLAAKLPGWKRYWYVEEKLKELQTARAEQRLDLRFAREQVQRAAPGDRAEQEKLFQQFLDWAKTRQR